MKLERYNQLIWTVLGTTIIVSVLSIVAISLFVFVFGRQMRGGMRVQRPNPAVAKSKTEEKAVYGNPIVTDYSENVMIPVEIIEVSRSDKGESGGLSLIKGGYHGSSHAKFSCIYYGFSWARFNNIIFHNIVTNESHMLLHKKALISFFYYPYEKEDKSDTPVAKFLLFGISENDTNGDGLINEADAIIGYMSDLSGKALWQITPANTQLMDWALDKNTGSIFARVKKDSDGDGKFSDRDDIVLLRVNASAPAQGVEIIDEQMRADINSMLN